MSNVKQLATKPNGPFRYDVVGSFLRSAAIKEARQAHSEGKLDDAGLRAVEDKEIAALVAKQKEVGLQAVTDGEFRRSYWHLDFLQALEGVEKVAAEQWSVNFKGHQPKAATLRIVGKLGFGNHPFLQDFKDLQAIAGDTTVKFTIPSPSMLHLICCVREENYEPLAQYQDEAVLFKDLAETYRKAIQAFYAAGCRYLQLDDTSWGEFCDAEKQKAYAARGIDVKEVGKRYVEVINYALQDKPEDLTVTMHICRGNFRSTWFSSGGYEPVAETLFAHCKVDGFFLEYDSDRAGSFEPLRHIKDQYVVLGLVTSKFAELEKEADLKARVAEAALYVPKEQLCISPQCGFASTEEGNELTEEEQWNKIRLLKRVAEEIW